MSSANNHLVPSVLTQTQVPAQTLEHSPTYIMLGVSTVNQTFCISVSHQLFKGKILPRRLCRGEFPYTITTAYRTNIQRRDVMNSILSHSICSGGGSSGSGSGGSGSNGSNGGGNGYTVTNLPLQELPSMQQYVLQIFTDWPFTQSVIEQVDLNTEPAKEVVDLAELSVGINWIILGKKTRPDVISFV